MTFSCLVKKIFSINHYIGIPYLYVRKIIFDFLPTSAASEVTEKTKIYPHLENLDHSNNLCMDIDSFFLSLVGIHSIQLFI